MIQVDAMDSIFKVWTLDLQPHDITMKSMRAKLQIESVLQRQGADVLKFHAVTGKPFDADGISEDNTFAKFSPSVSLEITVCNPALLGQFKPGEKYYVDFTPADDPAPAGA